MLKAVKYSLGLDQYHIFIEQRGDDSWALVWAGRRCMDKDGKFNEEPSPSNRSEKYIKNHRFKTPEEALVVFAQKAQLIINGKKIGLSSEGEN